MPDKKIVLPKKALEIIEPGMSIFIGTGAAEPRTLVKHLMASNDPNLEDLELIQLVSLGDTVSIKELYSQKFRLKTFYSGWAAREAITAGRVDLIPCRFSKIPLLFKTGRVRIDVAFVQVLPPDKSGYCSLGIAIDVAREAMEKASIVVGEINTKIPETFGDTFMYRMLISLAKEEGLQGFTADVLSSNIEMMKIFSKGGQKTSANLENGLYEVTIHF